MTQRDTNFLKRRSRSELFDASCFRKGGQSEVRAKYDPRRLREEALCLHALEDLSWGVNQNAEWASCSECGLLEVSWRPQARAEALPLPCGCLRRKSTCAHDREGCLHGAVTDQDGRCLILDVVRLEVAVFFMLPFWRRRMPCAGHIRRRSRWRITSVVPGDGACLMSPTSTELASGDIRRADSGHPCVSLVDFPMLETHHFQACGSLGHRFCEAEMRATSWNQRIWSSRRRT